MKKRTQNDPTKKVGEGAGRRKCNLSISAVQKREYYHQIQLQQVKGYTPLVSSSRENVYRLPNTIPDLAKTLHTISFDSTIPHFDNSFNLGSFATPTLLFQLLCVANQLTQLEGANSAGILYTILEILVILADIFALHKIGARRQKNRDQISLTIGCVTTNIPLVSQSFSY